MKLIIFGAAGSIGRHVVKQAYDQGHAVTAFTRSGNCPDGAPSGVHTVKGDVLTPTEVAHAIEGHDAVIVVLGSGMKGGLRAPGTANIIAGMKFHRVQTLICQSTLGAGESVGNLNFWWRYVMFGLLLRQALADHEEQEQLVRDSRLDWTIVRPAAFVDGPRTGQYQTGFGPRATGLSLSISRADVADFLLKQLDGAGRGQAIGLSY